MIPKRFQNPKTKKSLSFCHLILAFLLLFVLLLPQQTALSVKAASNTGKTGYVNFTYLNLRKESTTSSGLVIKLSKNDPVTILVDEGAWLKVKAKHDGKEYTGYAWYKYITINQSSGGQTQQKPPSETKPQTEVQTGSSTSKNPTGYVNFTYLNLREKATTSSKLLLKLSKNDKVEILENLNGWYRVNATHSGKAYKGYVASRYITLDKNSSPLSSLAGASSANNSGNTSGTVSDSSSKDKTKAVTMNSVYVSSSGSASISWTKLESTDGYVIYRKAQGKDFKEVALVDKEKNSYSEKGLEKGVKYVYMVAGYRKDGSKKLVGNTTSGMAPTLPYSGDYVFNTTKTYIGKTGAGRSTYSYTIGNGSNHMVITCAVHGFEDSWYQDGKVLVQTGESLVKKLADSVSTVNNADFKVLVVPMANADGVLDGTTNNGPGRCTTYRYNESGSLVKGGVDINRSFPSGFAKYTSARNYTGSQPLMSKESKYIKSLLDKNIGSKKNYYIDAHGWYNQIITKKAASGPLYTAFHKYFPNSRPAGLGTGSGYVAKYASSIGYEAMLFEFPYAKSASAFNSSGNKTKFINAVMSLIR